MQNTIVYARAGKHRESAITARQRMRGLWKSDQNATNPIQDRVCADNTGKHLQNLKSNGCSRVSAENRIKYNNVDPSVNGRQQWLFHSANLKIQNSLQIQKTHIYAIRFKYTTNLKLNYIKFGCRSVILAIRG